jgi:general L-amino acid transport system permease protein
LGLLSNWLGAGLLLFLEVNNRMKKKDSSVTTPFWRDKRIIPILLQLLFAITVVLAGAYFFTNAINGLNRMGINLGFSFLSDSASFAIGGDKLIEFQASDTYGRAVLVGLTNTLKVAFFGIILTTILGITIGIARLSTNWLMSTLARVYIEIFRNTPLLVQIFIWFYAVFLTMPRIEDSFHIANLFYFSNRRVAMPWLEQTAATGMWMIFFIIGVLIAFVLWRTLLKRQVESGQRKFPGYWAGGSIVLLLAIAWIVSGLQSPFNFSAPVLAGNRFVGGFGLDPSFLAILIALVAYTSAFVAEIVRSGIQAVSKGQVEAAKALGLKASTILRLVIFPQAIRIIIPPVTSQYLNLIKNSSLAVAIGYADIVFVGNTIMNQTGRAIEAITIMLLVYLSFSLLTSLFMNIFNKYTQLVER